MYRQHPMRSTQRPVHPHDVDSAIDAEVAVPLIVVGKVMGAQILQSRANHERYDPDDIALLAKPAHELAVTLLWSERDAVTA